ncbi:hypothetical protein [Microbacterium galbinum]|uniref:Uncharacterized protein n=1 Tax=Microbacterium galbinum TaxID=2851646 RepID=A0ABY4IN37_9MICO|nr:hypothetical protein [Microbacterium galbinum]UPL14034.1 hypothetical protein KV396_05890 [Microbacterium galbinum]
MTTAAIARDLAGFLVPIGWIGAAIAVVCAIVAGAAIARGAGGLSGGAVGVWIPAALLSSTASFAHQWLPLIISGAALGAMLVLGGIVRAIISAADNGRMTRSAARAAAVVEAAQPAPATTTIRVPARTPSTSTGAIAVVR